jgi:hypothetical protein
MPAKAKEISTMSLVFARETIFFSIRVDSGCIRMRHEAPAAAGFVHPGGTDCDALF